MSGNKKSNIVRQLTCAALALPGLVKPASAGRVEETYNADFQYGNYAENGGRMSVDIFEGVLLAPIGKTMSASVNLLRDTISGASPVYNTRDAQGNIHQIITGASKSSCGKTICDQRDAASAGLTYFFDQAALNLGGGYSSERDYASKYFSTAASLDLNKKLTTVNFGASVAFDEISPAKFKTACGDKCSKTVQQYLLGLSQIIDKDSLIQSNITFAYHSGFLTDPYKFVGFTTGNSDLVSGASPINLNNSGGIPGALTSNFAIPEKRPRDKFQWAWLTQYVRHFDAFNDAALHADYRFSTDDWGVNAHTVELSWHQPITDGWQVIPRFRYYSQDKADFYQAVFDGNLITDPNSGFVTAKNFSAYSSDYRLAGFGTLSGGIKLSKEFTELTPLSQLKFQTSFEYFARKADYQLGSNSHDTFADYGYYLVTASFNLKF